MGKPIDTGGAVDMAVRSKRIAFLRDKTTRSTSLSQVRCRTQGATRYFSRKSSSKISHFRLGCSHYNRVAVSAKVRQEGTGSVVDCGGAFCLDSEALQNLYCYHDL